MRQIRYADGRLVSIGDIARPIQGAHYIGGKIVVAEIIGNRIFGNDKYGKQRNYAAVYCNKVDAKDSP